MYDLLKNVHFMKNRRIYYIITILLIVVSITIGCVRGFNMGIDFTGGTLLEFEMGKEVKISDVQDVLKSQDLSGTVMYAGENNKDIIIKTGDSLDTDTRSSLQDAMNEKFGIDDDALISVENIGPSVGKSLRTGAAKAVAAAVILMLIYIAIRFMFKYGIAAILALANTILLMIGFYGAFHITINSPFIAAVLTILGYGINDTIVIFDRVRENTGGRAVSKSTAGLDLLVDESIKQTVGRSLMTSITTISVMVPLIICGTTIREFIVPILVGVIASTCSSIFIATSLWYDIMRLTDKNSPKNRERAKKKRERKLEKERQKREIAKEKEKAAKERERQAKQAERQRRAEEKKQEAERKKREREAEEKKKQADDASIAELA